MSLHVSCEDMGSAGVLQNAILLYGTQNNLNYASVHDIEFRDEKPYIKAGVAVSKQAVEELFSTLNPRDKAKPMLLPENILATGDGYLAWYTPPQNCSLFFKCPELGGEVSAKVPLPGLVFIVNERNGWFVFAYKGTKKPTASTKLYQTGFLNVWKDGKICEGNVSRPKSMTIESVGAWESNFFRSRFTHTNGSPVKKIGFEGGVYGFWNRLIAGDWDSFPSQVLVPTQSTLAQQFDIIF